MSDEDNDKGLLKMMFELDPDDWHGTSAETVWVKKVGENHFEVRNTPFYAKGVSFHDVVIAIVIEKFLTFQSTVLPAGHSTYRVVVEKTTTDTKLEEYWKPLQALGCTYESATLGLLLLAVDVPPEADIYEVYGLLEKGENDNIWDFEEGHCGHPVTQ